jgi:hypothetical protein
MRGAATNATMKIRMAISTNQVWMIIQTHRTGGLGHGGLTRVGGNPPNTGQGRTGVDLSNADGRL